jgi:HicA toxin of bacterial toxin-antitoxin,
LPKRSELERWMRRHDCEHVREGASHSIWRNAITGDRAPVPRHREISKGTARAVCKQLGIPPLP